MSDEQQVFYRVGVALAIGMLIGLERAWHKRAAEEGTRIAGVRTYGLIGLLGGASALLALQLGPLALGIAFVGVAGAVTTAYVIKVRREGDVGITSLVAALLTFVLGALAALGEVAISAAAAVVTALILSYKPLLHRWVSALEADELHAGIRLLLISVVLLPILPNQGYGPWHALNPYAIWWMVVLIAAISFAGYFAIKIGGARRGAVFTGLFGGLASSTAVTLHFSRLARRDRSLAPILASGILIACGTMFLRMLLVASLLNPRIFSVLVAPAAVMALLVYAPAFLFYRAATSDNPDVGSSLKNPLELRAALSFGLLLALVLVLGKALQASFGTAGVLSLAAASGIADVDAITLSLARMSNDDLAYPLAVVGIVIAATVNGLAKAGLASVLGGRDIGLRVGLPLLASALGGLAVTWFRVL